MDWSEAEGDEVVVELHDSQVVSMRTEGTTRVIRLSPAWVHRSLGIPGRDVGTQWNQEAILRLDEAQETGTILGFPPWLTDGSSPITGYSINNCISDGSLTVDGIVLNNCIPAPADLTGEIRLLLELGASTIDLAARRFRLELVGEPEFIDVWPPS